jgi:RimJ/RimL family protein N-acetyltransferase
MAASRIEEFRERLFPGGHFVTKRLVFRPLQAGDAFQLVVLTNDPLVANGVSLLRQPFTLTDAQELIALPREGRGCFAAVREGFDGPFIGCAGAVVRSATDIEIGFWLGAPYHGKRFGAEMARGILERLLEAFPGKRIVAECPRENSASWRLLKRLGFCPSGAQGLRKGAHLLIFEAPAVVE